MTSIVDFQNTPLNLGDQVAFIHGIHVMQRGTVTGSETIRGLCLLQIVTENLDGSTSTFRVHPAQVVKLTCDDSKSDKGERP